VTVKYIRLSIRWIMVICAAPFLAVLYVAIWAFSKDMAREMVGDIRQALSEP
jgi:hypothetical protein